MNVQLANVISDISGVTGMAILRAILDGERDRDALAALADARIQATREEIAKSLEGNWRDDLLFVVNQQLRLYQTCQQQIRECDEAIQSHLRNFPSQAAEGSEPPPPKAGKKARGNAPQFDLRGELYRISGTDLTRIDGIDVMVAQTLIAEVGLDMSRWPTEGHFSSWLGLCPDNRSSGGKVLHRGTRHVNNRAATALRMAATSLWRSKTTYLGAKFRRFRSGLGAPKAITAMAHALAKLVYRMLKYGQEYVDQGMQYYEQRFKEQEIRAIHKKAANLGLIVTLTPAPALA
jgi:transposase